MEITTIKAKARTAIGKSHVRELRQQGYVPAVVYGDGKEPTAVQLDETDLQSHLRHHHRVFQLEVGGQQQAIYLQEVQWDPIADRVLHVDLKRVDLTKPMSVLVEINFLGHPVGISKGGRFIKDHPQLRVKCLPTKIPDNFEVNVGHLEIDAKILASEVKLPEGVTLDILPSTVVCHVVFQKVEVIAAPAAAVVEGAVPAEGAAAAPAAGAAAGAAPAAAGDKKGAGGAAAGAAPADAKKAGGDKGAKK